MHTRVVCRIVEAGILKSGDKFCPLARRPGGDEALANRLLKLGTPTKGWGNTWTRTDAPCPDDLAEAFVSYVMCEEMDEKLVLVIVAARDLKLGDMFRPVYPARAAELLESPLLILGAAAEDHANIWIRGDAPCPDELAEDYVYLITVREV